MRLSCLKPAAISVMAFIFLATAFAGQRIFASGVASDGYFHFKMMTYNIAAGQGKPNNSTKYAGTKYLDMLVKLLKAEKPDVIGMQEVDDNRFTTRFVNEAKYLGERLAMFYYWHEASTVGPLGMINKHGNSISSKFKILKKECIEYKSKGKKSDGGAAAETRAFTSTLIDVNGTKINFISTHLGFPEYARIGQAKELVEYIKKLKEPVIVVGDFNTRRGKPDYNIVAAKLTDAYSAAKEKGAEATCGGHCIDFVFYTPGFFECDRAWAGGDEYKDASDHRPMITLLKFKKSGATIKSSLSKAAAGMAGDTGDTAEISAGTDGKAQNSGSVGDKKLLEIKQKLLETGIE